MKIAVLWTGLSGYLNACLKELASREGVEILVAHNAPEDNAPYDDQQFSWITKRYVWKSKVDAQELGGRLQEFRPDVLVVAGWHISAYQRIARAHRTKCWRVMTMDNPWKGTLRQRVGILLARWFLRPIADAVWLPGERQAIFARRLGFSQREILRGLYSCDRAELARVYEERINEMRPLPRVFLFSGRFVPEKGIETLVKAYEIYRKTCDEPWPLVCCGTGPLQPLIAGRSGIKTLGFVQPSGMAPLLATAGCLIVPSHFEPWALVVHEATTAGLVVLASEKVGSAVHLVQSGYNGFIFQSSDPLGLAELMMRMSALGDERLNEMSRASHHLSLQFSPERWADTLISEYHATFRTAMQ